VLLAYKGCQAGVLSFKTYTHITETYVTRDITSIRLSKEELNRLKTVEKEIYGEEIAENVPHAKALEHLIDVYQSAE